MATKKKASSKPRGGRDLEGKDPIIFWKAWRLMAPPPLLELSVTVLLGLRGHSASFRGHSLHVALCPVPPWAAAVIPPFKGHSFESHIGRGD